MTPAKRPGFLSLLTLLVAFIGLIATAPRAEAQALQLTPLGTYQTGVFDEGAAEIVAHDPRTQRLFVVNGADATIDVIDINNPTNPTLLFSIDVSTYGNIANSVAVHPTLPYVIAAVENDDTQAPGHAVFFDLDGHFLGQVTVGALPDMITVSPNGMFVLVANEGEPNDDYTVDPEGTVSIIDLKRSPARLTDTDVRTVDFRDFNAAALDPSIRVFGPDATVAQDFEPEYIAVSNDSRTAWVTLQENNALAVIDLIEGRVEALVGLGFKDHAAAGNGLDASNEDGGINIANWPVKGMYQPDAIAAFHTLTGDYLITANEGDARDYDGFSGEERIGDLPLDPGAFPDAATLQLDENLGRLNSTLMNGDTDGDGDYDEVYAYGARSFSIWSPDGALVYDNGDDLEQRLATRLPDAFNSTNNENDSFDNRSDDKGPEPEGVVVGTVGGRTYAFIGLERIGGVMVYDVTNPTAPSFVAYVNTRDFGGDPEASLAGDLAPEGLVFINPWKSPTGTPLLVVAYEVSGSTTIFEIETTAGKDDPRALAPAEQPEGFVLAQNFPNPFNPETSIRFQLPEARRLVLTIHDVLDRTVATLADGLYEAGAHDVRWNGRDVQGRPVSSGTYLYRLVAGDVVQTRVMMLAK